MTCCAAGRQGRSVGGDQCLDEAAVVARHDADDFRSRFVMQRGGQCVCALVDLTPRQRVQFVDETGPVRTTLRGAGESGCDAHVFALHRRSNPQVFVGPQRGDEAGARASSRQGPTVAASRSPRDMRLAQHREPSLGGQFAERTLHHVPHMGVDLVYVGILAELGHDVDRRQHLHHDLGRQRNVRGEHHAQAKREAERDRHDLGACQTRDRPELLGQPGAAGQEDLGLLPADADRGHDGHPALRAALM